MSIIQDALASYVSFPGLLACCYVAYKPWEEEFSVGLFPERVQNSTGTKPFLGGNCSLFSHT